MTPYIRELKFGDGYSQITGKGYVAIREEWDVEYVPVDKTTADSLESSLLATKDGRIYYVRVLMPNESSYKFYSADNISKSPVGPDLWQVRCTMKMEFTE